MTECEICLGRGGESRVIDSEPVCTLSVTPDDSGGTTDIRVCRPCITAMFEVMMARYRKSALECQAEVNAMLRMLGMT